MNYSMVCNKYRGRISPYVELGHRILLQRFQKDPANKPYKGWKLLFIVIEHMSLDSIGNSGHVACVVVINK